MVDLYEDRTIPMMTDALGRLMLDVRSDKEIQNALARVDARKGYRPPSSPSASCGRSSRTTGSSTS